MEKPCPIPILLWTSAKERVIIERMFGEITAFRHFGCGGTIYRRDWTRRTIFKCAVCLRGSEDLLDLVKDPDLIYVPDDENQTPISDLTSG